MNTTVRRLARTAGPAAVLTGLAAVTVAALPSTASASIVCFGAYRTHVVVTRATAQITCEFTYTGGQQRFKVPGGVTNATADLIGARAGNGFGATGSGGLGAPGQEEIGTIPTTPGTWLYIVVGGVGTNGGATTGGNGGFNGGAPGGSGQTGGGGGGGGGGASDIRTIPNGGSTLSSRLLVAPGGGGGGGAGSCHTGGFGSFVDNGAASSGSDCGSPVEHGGQGGGTAFPWTAGTGGADGSTTGTAGMPGTVGTAGLGGAGGSGGGGAGGGGGGWTGGGGGGGGAYKNAIMGSGGGGEGGIPGSNGPTVNWNDVGPTSAAAAVSLTFHQPLSQPRPHRAHTSLGKQITPATGSHRPWWASRPWLAWHHGRTWRA